MIDSYIMHYQEDSNKSICFQTDGLMYNQQWNRSNQMIGGYNEDIFLSDLE